jgi:hypothetical protein
MKARRGGNTVKSRCERGIRSGGGSDRLSGTGEQVSHSEARRRALFPTRWMVRKQIVMRWLRSDRACRVLRTPLATMTDLTPSKLKIVARLEAEQRDLAGSRVQPRIDDLA